MLKVMPCLQDCDCYVEEEKGGRQNHLLVVYERYYGGNEAVFVSVRARPDRPKMVMGPHCSTTRGRGSW